MKKSNFQFANPWIESLKYSENEHFDMQGAEIKMENNFNVEVERAKDRDEAKVSLKLCINASETNAPFSLTVKMSALFRWVALSDNQVESMLKINAPALLLGYMRPIVANITNSSRYPVYNIPMINFAEE